MDSLDTQEEQSYFGHFSLIATAVGSRGSRSQALPNTVNDF